MRGKISQIPKDSITTLNYIVTEVTTDFVEKKKKATIFIELIQCSDDRSLLLTRDTKG